MRLFVFPTVLFLAVAAAIPFSPYDPLSHSKCPPFSGNFTVHAYQLYPENADFDFNHCLLYIGMLWNASVGIYNPYTRHFRTVEFEGITHNPEFHIGGVAFNHRTNFLSIVVDTGAAFNTNGQDISGTNYIMLWDPFTGSLLYKKNLTEVSQGRYGAFQDVELDPENNVYVVGTYPSSIMRVDAEGKEVVAWYVDDDLNHTIAGYGGLASKGWTLLTNDQATGSLYRFDMRDERGTPILIPTTPNHTIVDTDAIHLPRRYHGTVLLVSENGFGASVYRSADGEWEEAQYLGLVPWPEKDRFTTATLQIGDAVYFNLEPFGDPGLKGPGTAGNRTDFPYVDITAEIDALLEKEY